MRDSRLSQKSRENVVISKLMERPQSELYPGSGFERGHDPHPQPPTPRGSESPEVLLEEGVAREQEGGAL